MSLAVIASGNHCPLASDLLASDLIASKSHGWLDI
jgi:hypothetical protein